MKGSKNKEQSTRKTDFSKEQKWLQVNTDTSSVQWKIIKP